MPSEDDSPALKGKRARGGDIPPAPHPQVPRHARIWLSVGTFAGLFCAEAMSSMRLFSLGERAGYPPFLAWLLPGALDVYALTLVWFFSQLPAEHPLRAKAAREAAYALGITVVCNALDEVVEAFARQLPYWAPGALFVLISALAPFVAYRLIHFRAEIGNDTGAIANEVETDKAPRKNVNDTGKRQRASETSTGNGESGNAENPSTGIGNPAVNDNPPDRRPPADNPSVDNPRDRQKPAAKQSAAGQPSTDTWVEIGKPLYDGLRAELGKRPGETKFCAALTERVTDLIARGELPDVYAAPSLSTAKRIRGEIEERFPGIIFGHAAEVQPDVAEEVA